MNLVTKYFPAMVLVFIGLSNAFGASSTDTSDQPSFSCLSPTKLEATICADPTLTARDRTMAALYAVAHNGIFGSRTSQEETRQKKWLKDRDVRCPKEETYTCLVDAYDDRLYELAVAALFQSPTLALAEIRRQKPKSAPIYEAIYNYVTRDQASDRAKIVEPLIAPLFQNVDEDLRDRILSGEDILDAHAAVASDFAFALILDVASINETRLILPCVALIRRPNLVDALGPHYSGALDGSLIRSNCMEVLPSIPGVDRLVNTAVSVQPFCPGTIRFSLARAYDQTLVEIRLHLRYPWKTVGLPESEQANENNFRSSHQAPIEAAIAELANYYAEYFGISKQQARIDANSAINAVIGGAFNLCEEG